MSGSRENIQSFYMKTFVNLQSFYKMEKIFKLHICVDNFGLFLCLSKCYIPVTAECIEAQASFCNSTGRNV